ncbi:hypothetical protein [Spirillospora albida]|uniref:hypothetical protein n=1 Tax=Spirillospora albida TaxID=58123 RepID=UPI0004BEC69C|nr:hypothetical protein [Spirillospora albida]
MNGRALLVRGGTAVAGTVMLAGAMWLHALEPRIEARELDPIRSHGRLGDEIGNRDFSLKVEGVDAARSLAPSLSFARTRTIGTDGVYLAVRVRVMSRREPLSLRSATLETPGGYAFDAEPRLEAANPALPVFQPLIWTPAVFVFELPRKRLAGARLVVGAGGLLPQLSAATDVDLRINEDGAAELLRTAADGLDVRKGSS